jgi:hypothetical protein
MDFEREIDGLTAETIAIQAVLLSVLGRLSQADPALFDVIKLGFDDAASYVESFKLGPAASPHHLPTALQMVEGWRFLTLGNPDQSKHGV